MNKKIIISIIFLLLLVGIILFGLCDRRKKDENGNYIYICKSYQNDLQSKTIAIYKLKINNENNIVHLYKGKQYIFSDKIDYFTMVHDVSSKNVDYEVNFETLTITINGYDEPLVD